MKKRAILLAVILTVTVAFQSCKDGAKDKEQDKTVVTPEAQELKEFMLGGMYFINGYGGVTAVEGMIPTTDDAEEMISSYREILIFPFGTDQGNGIKIMFRNMWDIHNKADLEKSMTKLLTVKDTENPHKAWDYARIANNACMGYAAGYLTKEEAKKYISDAFALAQKEFKTWEEYMVDYNKGRFTWDPESEDKEAFDKITAELTKNPKGIYSILPLN
ncbi:DUF1266 domain-containing protein [Flavobacterium sp. PL002]|uniref:DUF1266 domain-containing protein n=1 Tax=Flavobacterium sp. PL002 TaxID=1897058 RepID=UPI0017883369|nr:DUF1266 domain-containing protein [Flavobacterium sp. PL002]MBE0390816.1 hypothetical protein [Flavobacterium sp. PL002]